MTALGLDCIEKLGAKNGPHRKRTSEKLTAFRAFFTEEILRQGAPIGQ